MKLSGRLLFIVQYMLQSDDTTVSSIQDILEFVDQDLVPIRTAYSASSSVEGLPLNSEYPLSIVPL